MNRKHFEALAKALRETKASTRTIEAIAAVCSDTNPNFDYAGFRSAASSPEKA